MKETHTQSYAVDLLAGGVLILYTQTPESISKVAQATDALLRWLGTPRGFTVYLWWRDDPRILGHAEWPSRDSVNGGWATPGSPNVHIYRQEEWERVLIHETIHAMKWDWVMPTTPMPCWGMNEDDHISPYLAEAWTELYAEWLWCGWFNQSWEKQRAWQDKQAIQILARAPKIWKEETNVFAYYILKAALAPHIEFLWMFGNGKHPEERRHVLCTMVKPHMEQLRHEAKVTAPTSISMRMTHI